MTREENECVGCQMPCIYEACPYYRVERRYCDRCDSPADYQIDGDDYCADCAEDFIKEQLKEADIDELIDFLMKKADTDDVLSFLDMDCRTIK